TRGALSAGRRTGVGNGHGARTRIASRSATPGRHSAHCVAMPEGVVAGTQVEIDGRGPGVAAPAATLYAYGDAQLSYDPVFARFAFAGYRRRVAVHGVLERQQEGLPLEVNGFAVIEDYAPAAVAGEGFRQRAPAGRLIRVSRLAGLFAPDPTALLDIAPSEDARWMGDTSLRHEVAMVPHDTSLRPATDECLDVDPYGDPKLGGAGDTPDSLCREA